MFFRLASAVNPPQPPALPGPITQADAETILAYEAPTISYLLESAWASGGPGLLPIPISTLPPALVGVVLPGPAAAAAANRPIWSVVFDHLIYAYMVENTRSYEIFRRVLWEYAHGERLGIPRNDASHRWLRTTEELFYKDASVWQPFNLVSRIRPDISASRRNAYYRMFGMDLNHGIDGSTSYPYEKPAAANREFVFTFEEFLREVWRAIENATNLVGANPTDRTAILDLSLRLQNMLTGRRGGDASRPNLARDAFLATSLMSWLHLTVSFNTPIVTDLVATGPSPAERLRLIGERVGVPAHGRSHSYFIIAPLISTLLNHIELGNLDQIPEIETLFGLGPNRVRDDTATIITHWSMITGRDLKAPRTTLSPAGPMSRPATAGAGSYAAPAGYVTAAAAVPSGNGKVPAGSS